MVLEVPLKSNVAEPDRTAQAQSGWQDIMTDGFEGTFPGVWVSYSNTDTDAYWGQDSYNPHNGSYSAFCARSGSDGVNPPGSYPNNMDAWMAYGPFSLEDAIDAELNFWFWQRAEAADDYLFWGASTTGDWFYGYAYLADSNGWQSESFDLTHAYLLGDLCGQPQVWIAFAFTSDMFITGQGAFVDDVVLRKNVGANSPPNAPSHPSPGNHATGLALDADLSWTGGDPDPGDTVSYDVYFGSAASLSRASDDQSACIYDPGTLNGNTKYYWKIVARDNHGAATIGPLWDFTTEPGPGIAWTFPSTSDVSLGPTPDNGRPYLDAAVALPTGTEPPELIGVYRLDEAAGLWEYFIPGFTLNTLTSLEPGQIYLTAVSGSCSWNLPCGEGTASPTGNTWNFPATSEVFLAPTTANGRPYLDASVPLPTGTEPPELSGVYWLDEETGEWKYFIPALGVGTLSSLEPGQAYQVAVSGPCSWNLHQQ